jgi:O-methyltransferase involved in polyketide biosynthesis
VLEGVVPYLEEEQVADLAQDLRDRPEVALWIVEFFSEFSYRYMRRVGQSRQMANSPFKFFPKNWMEFFRERGWERKDLHFFGEIARPFRRRRFPAGCSCCSCAGTRRAAAAPVRLPAAGDAPADQSIFFFSTFQSLFMHSPQS